MGACILFWTFFALLAGVAGVTWRKSPRPVPAGPGGSPEAVLEGKVRRFLMYLVGFLALVELFVFLREGRPSKLLLVLMLLVYLGYGVARAQRPPSRRAEAFSLLALLALGGASLYLAICLGR